MFTFQSNKYIGKVVDVYDGDTITIGFLLYSNPIKMKVRLSRIDTPETKLLKNNENCELHKKCGLLVRNHLRNMIQDKIVTICTNNTNDKYGRILGEVSFNNINVSDYLLNNGFAKPYYGKKKESFSENDLNKILQNLEFRIQNLEFRI